MTEKDKNNLPQYWLISQKTSQKPRGHRYLVQFLGEGEIREDLSYRAVKADSLEATPPMLINRFEDLKQIVADYFEIGVADLVGRRKLQDFAIPRHIAMYLCRTLYCASLVEIGRAFARSHGDVVNSCKRVKVLVKKNKALRRDLEVLVDRIKKS